MKWAALAAFTATIPLANWMIGNVGTVCIPDGPCVLPVGFGLTAPSGVLVIGVALVVRDMVQRHAGIAWALAAILVGSVLSYALADPVIATASAIAFLLAELADTAIYTPLARKRLWVATVASGLVGSVVDSAVFLWLAFGSLELIEGQVLGKLYASVLFAGWLWYRSSRREPA